MSNQVLIATLEPVLARLSSLDLNDAAAARAALVAEFPPHGPLVAGLRGRALEGLAKGWRCDREAGESRFSRVAKADAAMGYSIDAVLLSGDGPWHRHTRGEVNCLLPLEGTPRFCGVEPPWAVFAPGSEHIPRVEGGRLLILYMLPGGAIEWKRPA